MWGSKGKNDKDNIKRGILKGLKVYHHQEVLRGTHAIACLPQISYHIFYSVLFNIKSYLDMGQLTNNNSTN